MNSLDLTLLYLLAVRAAARGPELPQDIDIEHPQAMDIWPTVQGGLHYLLPIGTLIWCLMVDEMSPRFASRNARSSSRCR